MLAEAIARVRARLEKSAAPAPIPPGDIPAALDILTPSLRLTPFERDLLVLAAAAEMDAPTISLIDGVDPRRPALTFTMALRWLEAPHWSAFSPSAPLRRWWLLEMDPGQSLMYSPVWIDERVLHFLMGVAAEDQRLGPLIAPLPEPGNLPPVQPAAAARAAAALSEHRCPLVQICGKPGETRRLGRSGFAGRPGRPAA